MFSLIPVAQAQTEAQVAAQCLVDAVNNAILFPLIALMMALAFLFFLYGAFEFVKNANNESGREAGKTHLLYGVIGMLVMLSAFAILNIAAGTFGIPVGEVRRGDCSQFGSRGPGGSGIPTGTTGPGGIPSGSSGPGGIPTGTSGPQ